jgi:hypothetical protein
MPTSPDDLSKPGALGNDFCSGVGSDSDDIQVLVWHYGALYARAFRELPASRPSPLSVSREFTTGLLCRGMKWVLALTFEGLSGIVPRHLFRRAGFGAPAM